MARVSGIKAAMDYLKKTSGLGVFRVDTRKMKNIREITYNQGISGNICKSVRRTDGKEFYSVFDSNGKIISVQDDFFAPKNIYNFEKIGNTTVISQKANRWPEYPEIGTRIISDGKILKNTLT
jgi:hypothetical protein